MDEMQETVNEFMKVFCSNFQPAKFKMKTLDYKTIEIQLGQPYKIEHEKQDGDMIYFHSHQNFFDGSRCHRIGFYCQSFYFVADYLLRLYHSGCSVIVRLDTSRIEGRILDRFLGLDEDLIVDVYHDEKLVVTKRLSDSITNEDRKILDMYEKRKQIEESVAQPNHSKQKRKL